MAPLAVLQGRGQRRCQWQAPCVTLLPVFAAVSPSRCVHNVSFAPAVCPTASRVCDLTGKRANNGYVVTFSHKRNKKMQQVNLQYKKVYWPEGQR